MTPDLESELDTLYRAPLGEFVAQRNQLARTLKQAGQKAEAERIAKLQRPTPVAWVINQLNFRHTEVLNALLESGAALREAQEALSPAEEFAAIKRSQQQALRLATEAAVNTAEGAGMAMNAGLRRRIELALALVSTSRGTVAVGRLAAEPAPAGFDAFADAELPVRAAETAEERAHAGAKRVAVEDARTAIAAIERELSRLDEEARAAHARYEAAAAEAAEMERRAESARRTRDEARREAEAAKTKVDETRGALARQRKALDAVD